MVLSPKLYGKLASEETLRNDLDILKHYLLLQDGTQVCLFPNPHHHSQSRIPKARRVS